MKRLIPLLCLLSSVLYCEQVKFPWLVYYNNVAPSSAFDAYNPIIFDETIYPPLKPLLEKHKEILGYIALGEVSERNPWFKDLKEKGLLIAENPVWTGSWSIDVRNPYWKNLLLDKILPDIFEKGFTGLFLDQLDIVIALELNHPEQYKGMIASAADLVNAIHKRFQEHRLMMNRAYEILPQVGNSIAYELAETMYTLYNFDTKKYEMRSQPEIDWQLAQINGARTQFPHLVVFSLDYWDPADKEMYDRIYAQEQWWWNRPYVSTPWLDEITPE